MGTEKMQAVIKAVEEWQNEDSDKRATVVLTLQNNGEDGTDCGVLYAGKGGDLITLIKEGLTRNNKQLARLVQQATNELMKETIFERLLKDEGDVKRIAEIWSEDVKEILKGLKEAQK